MAARWETFETLLGEVGRLWKLAAALVTCPGAIIQPTRQPVRSW